MNFVNLYCVVVMLLVLVDYGSLAGAVSPGFVHDRNNTATNLEVGATLHYSAYTTFAYQYLPYCDEATVSTECASIFRHLYSNQFVEGRSCSSCGARRVRATGRATLGGCRGYNISVITYMR